MNSRIGEAIEMASNESWSACVGPHPGCARGGLLLVDNGSHFYFPSEKDFAAFSAKLVLTSDPKSTSVVP